MKTMRLLSVLFACCFSSIVIAQPVEADITAARPVEGAGPVIIKRGEAGIRHFTQPVIGGAAQDMMFMSSGMMMGRLFPPDMIMRNQQRLALTDRQIKTIKDEMRSFQSGIVDIQWDLHEAQASLDKELAADRIDVDKALDLVDAVMRAENSLKKSHLALLIKIRNALNASQLDELEKLPGFFTGSTGMFEPAMAAYPAMMEWHHRVQHP